MHCLGEWRPGEEIKIIIIIIIITIVIDFIFLGEEMAEAVLRQELSNFHETVSHFSGH